MLKPGFLLILLISTFHINSEEVFDPLNQTINSDKNYGLYEAFSHNPDPSPIPSIKPGPKMPMSASGDINSYTTVLEDVSEYLKKNNSQSKTLTFFSDNFISVYINGVEFNLKGSFVFTESSHKLISVQGFFSDIVNYPSLYGDLDLYCWAQFDEQGNLRLAYPASDKPRTFLIGDLSIPYEPIAGRYYAKVFFREDGNIYSIHINNDLRLKVYNRVLKFKHHEGAGGDLYFYRDQKFRGGYLAEDTYIQGTVYPEGCYIEFWKNGKLRAATGSPDVWNRIIEIQGILIGTPELGGGVTFSSNDEITSVYAFSQDQTLYGNLFRAGQSMLSVKSEGKIIPSVENLSKEDTFYQIDISE